MTNPSQMNPRYHLIERLSCSFVNTPMWSTVSGRDGLNTLRRGGARPFSPSKNWWLSLHGF
jgi:hypothetical protein